MENSPQAPELITVLWPSFLIAGIATIIFFSVFDPQLLAHIAGFDPVSRMGGYTIGFFIFWLLTSLSSVLTCYFQKPVKPSQGK